MIKLKNSVTPPSLVIACAAANVAHEMGITVWITSGNDSKHMTGSRHYVNAALDFRRWNLSEADLHMFMLKLQGRLGKKYQVILEKDHVHVEKDDLS